MSQPQSNMNQPQSNMNQPQSNMNQPQSNMNSPTVLSRNALHTTVNRHIDRLSAAQWSMLAAGTWDSDTEAILADMLMEVIHKLSRCIIKTTMSKETSTGSGTICEDDVNTALENLCAQLPGTLASALHVTPDNCESAEPLKRMVQDEVSQKVKSVLSMSTASIISGSRRRRRRKRKRKRREEEEEEEEEEKEEVVEIVVEDIEDMEVISLDTSDDVLDDVKSMHCVNSLILYKRKFTKTSEDSDDFYMITPESSFDSWPSTSSDCPSPTTARLAVNITTALFTKIARKAPQEVSQRLQEMDVNAIIKRLSDKVMSEIEIPRSAETFMKKLKKAVVDSLDKEVCPKKHLLRAALADETAFGDAIVKYLKIHLDAMLNPPPKSKADRFFSAVGNAVLKTFNWCCITPSDD
ncbi:hypothetical protein D5F01_LYC18130 [Larimichthys crocea]|uniref:Uncharacterized protein n=1 Tax=Larimichthys crocea TaxID=215358 RepID=A0A6G0HUQ2_LARCR|nr:hypothetical protein D5F01_LYC18130 [Larimichthys crocea]